MDRGHFIGDKYTVDSEPVKTGEKTWDTLNIIISRTLNGNKKKVGSYSRNYPNLYKTFFPFMLKGKELALYSREYMYTRVMDLSTCQDLGGEDDNKVEYIKHFCPVEFYVPVYRSITFPGEAEEDWLKGDECFDPQYDDGKNILGPIQYCDFGFVAGCIWGDDTSWKIQFLDLSKARKGEIKRDDRFGYLELPYDLSLKGAIDMSRWEPGFPNIGVTHTDWKNLDK